ncbi:phospholipase C [Microbispora rosea]|uniref:phospholipase C n=1 Tax=Microbispora rosea TaxID=58117 RepID=UPI0034126E0A
MRSIGHKRAAVAAASVAALAATVFGVANLDTSANAAPKADNSAKTATPIKHVVVIYEENNSFDHYFGTYPHAANTDGTRFTAKAGTPIPNNYISHPDLLTNNPNAFNPQRLDAAHALTCDQSHSYGSEQKAFDGGLMDRFVEETETSSCSPSTLYGTDGIVMDYYDGNTVTALWTLAQNYAMSDNSFSTGFGPSTPGALNLVSGNTSGALSVNSVTGVPTSTTTTTVTSDPDPFYDDCADSNHTKTGNLTKMTGKNIGDLLNSRGVSWGWFQDGFTPTTTAADSPTGYAVCGAQVPITAENANFPLGAYVPHHEPFAYYESTSNPHHLLPASLDEVGHDGQANHNYDVSYFYQALAADKLPAVSFVKAAAAQDGHPGSSNPVDEQISLVKEINAIEASPAWADTAIVIAYDDSDGWYDHVAATITNGSAASGNSAICTNAATVDIGGQVNRCGPGPRQPLLVISPYAKKNFIDHTLTTQSSILKFIEDNWNTGRIGGVSADATSGDLDNMFDFKAPPGQAMRLTLAANGTVASESKVHGNGNGNRKN